ncbi:SGNH/GDSL hydrolase family protein [Marinobacter sp. NSM]|uniref:SGNH/GDSL hydrolase family protein n=1 Tax=Marinobacter sp. NSM TaxID=3458004 RepID=UPI004036D51B
MAKYNTGNPIGSADPRDRHDNSQAFDEAVSSENTTFTDRLGKSRLTLKGMEQVFDGGQPAIDAYYAAANEANRAKGEADRAGNEADRAEAAGDAAVIGASGVFEDTVAGIAGTPEGDYFSVPSPADSEYMILYRHDPGPVATETKRYPSTGPVLAAITGIGQSPDETSVTFGNISVATGSLVLTTGAQGCSAALPNGVISSIRLLTSTVSGTVSYSMYIWRPTGARLEFELVSNTPVSVVTDASGVASISPEDFGRLEVETGYVVMFKALDNPSRIHRWSSSDTADTRSLFTAPAATGVVGEVVSLAYGDLPLAMEISVIGTGLVRAQDNAITAIAASSENSASSGESEYQIGMIGGLSAAPSHAARCYYEVRSSGTVKKISAAVTAPSTADLLILGAKVGETRRIRHAEEISLPISGVNDVAISVNVNKGEAIALITKSGGFLYSQGAGTVGDGISFNDDSYLSFGGLVSDNVPLSTSFQATIVGPKYAALDTLDIGGEIISERFVGGAVPAGWSTAGGTWTVDGGLIPPASPSGYGVRAYIDEFCSLGRAVMSSRVTFNTAESIAGLVSWQSAGALMLIDGISGELQLRRLTASNTSALVKSVALPFSLVAGRSYTVSATKVNLTWEITASDTVTRQSVSLSSDISEGYTGFAGRYGVAVTSGDVVFEWFNVRSDYPSRPSVLVIGDSNGEGSNSGLAGAPSWPRLLEASLNNDVVLASVSGSTSRIFDRENSDLLRWRPKYVIWALGTNDTDLGSWRGWTSWFIGRMREIGAEPILCTVPPRVGSESLRLQMTNDVLNGFFGRVKYIDLAAAVTSGNDRETIDQSMYAGDGIHFSAVGHAAIMEQLAVDVPFIVAQA